MHTPQPERGPNWDFELQFNYPVANYAVAIKAPITCPSCLIVRIPFPLYPAPLAAGCEGYAPDPIFGKRKNPRNQISSDFIPAYFAGSVSVKIRV